MKRKQVRCNIQQECLIAGEYYLIMPQGPPFPFQRLTKYLFIKIGQKPYP